MHILKKPDLSDPKMRAKLAKGMGHNYYGEPAWPNDLLYIFPVVILGTIACVVGLAVLDPAMLADKADPFGTPLEIFRSGTSIRCSKFCGLFLTSCLGSLCKRWFHWD